jgi:hypothetical protein
VNRGRKKIVQLTTALCAIVIGAEAFVLGCNALLGNEPGLLGQDGGTTSSGFTCPASQKACAATCVSTTDPSVGCGGACTICQAEQNATSKCVLLNDVQTCALGQCNPQYGDCDNDAGDGCETHTTTTAHCGTCGNSCNDQPYCEPSSTSDAGYACSNVCDFDLCPNGTDAGACVDFATDKENCGACNKRCAVAHGSGSTCDDGGCVTNCDNGYFQCNGQCTGVSDESCGATCGPCPGGFMCDQTVGTGYGTCIPIPPPVDSGGGNGCTVSKDCNGFDICCGTSCVLPDNNHCGPLCADCVNMYGTGATCVSGVCQQACGPQYNCQNGGLCGCAFNTICNVSPDFSSNLTCGNCATNCADTATCCCPSSSFGGDAGPSYSCSGTVIGDDENGTAGCNCSI